MAVSSNSGQPIGFFELANGAKMPSIGFGTWQLVPDDVATEAVLYALDAGYRHIDTARIYSNEKGVGWAIKESGIARDEVFVTTKLWNTDHAYDAAMEAIDSSLKRLGLDYVDLYLVHWPGPDVLDGSWDAMQAIYKAGKAKAIGVSNFDVGQIEQLFGVGGQKPMVNQIELHPFNWTDQQELVEFCQGQGIIVEAYSPIKRLNSHGQQAVAKIGANYGKTASQVVLRWCLQHGTVPLPRSANPDHILENYEIYDFELTQDEMRVIDTIGR